MKPRLLASENFPAPSIRLLRDRGYDVAAVAEAGGTLADPDVLALAVAGKRWIVTFDRDYGELIFARGLAAPPAVILFKMLGMNRNEICHVSGGVSVPHARGDESPSPEA